MIYPQERSLQYCLYISQKTKDYKSINSKDNPAAFKNKYAKEWMFMNNCLKNVYEQLLVKKMQL